MTDPVLPANDHAPTPKWNKDGFKEFRDSLSLSRREEDDSKLQRLLTAAAKAPLAKAALDWAKEHGVELVVDRSIRTAAGVYHNGTGILAVSMDMLQPENRDHAIVTLVHEIRHAWQDWNDLLPTRVEGFLETYMRQTVLEADATAWGKVAAEEQKLVKEIERMEKRPEVFNAAARKEVQDRLEKFVGTPAPPLQGFFSEWYTSHAPVSYGILMLQGFAKKLSLKDVGDEIRELLEANAVFDETSEFTPFSKVADDNALPPNRGVSLAGKAGLAPLGRDFSGKGNYFEQFPEKELAKNILDPSRAQELYLPRKEFKGDFFEYLDDPENALPMLLRSWVQRVLQAEGTQAPAAAPAQKPGPAYAPEPLDPKREAIRAERERNRAAKKKSGAPAP